MSVIFSVALSVVALGFSMFVFVENRRRDRRDIFLKITEYLTSEDIQRGRYTLFEKVTDEASIEELSEHEYRDIHRTINAINILGLYVENGYISERDVIAVWAMLVYRAWRAAQLYVVHRTRTHGYNPWRYAGPLAQKCQDELERKGEIAEFLVWRRRPQTVNSTPLGLPSMASSRVENEAQPDLGANT